MAAGTYAFGAVCVDVSRMSVERDGVAVPLEPKALDVLLYLLAHRDRLVTKDELLDAVWKDTFVTPNALTRAVAQVRKALGDDAHEARIIETVSKRGYRFIAPVIETPAGQQAPPPATLVPGPPQARPDRRSLTLGVLAGFIVAVLGVAVWLASRDQSPPPAEIALTRFTTRQGYDSLPAISPDGRSVVYVSDRSGGLELYQTGVTIGAPEVALTSNGGRNTLPEWSPDGQWIAFHSHRFGGIWIVAAAGGVPQQIVEFGSDPSWSPGGDRLVFAEDAVSSATPSRLWTVRRDGTDRQPITFGTAMAGAVSQPAWSHNGRFVAFSLNQGNRFKEVWVTSIDGRVVRRIAQGLTGQDIRWAPQDDGLFWGGVNDRALSRLMSVAIDPETGDARGTPQARAPIDGGLDGLSIARDGRALFGLARSDSNLWQVALRGDDVGEPERLTNDAVRVSYPRIAPDGRVAFALFIEGRPAEAWIMTADGSDRTPLLPAGVVQTAQWSRDGRRMFALVDGKAVWIDLDTRRTTPISVTFDLAAGMQLAADDRGLLNHHGDGNGITNVWLSPFDAGPPRQMTFDAQGASYAAASPDGRWIGVQLTRGVDTWLGVMPARPGATIVPLVKDRGQSWLYSWSPDSRRLAFAGERDSVWNIYDVDRETGRVRQVTHWEGLEGYVRYPAWSPRGDRMVFERATRTSSIWTATLW